jgi:hypothetical protein
MAELVTGHAGKAHATAEQAAGLNAGILGLDDYVLNVHDKFEITVVSANKVTIGTGELVMQGRHVSQGTPEDLIVTNGSQGQKRNDLIVCRYAKGSQSVESAKLVVVRGTPTTGTPTDPALNTTSPLDGGTTYDMALYRVPLDGITIGTPVPLFNVLRPMSDVWDSLSPTRFTFGNPQNGKVGTIANRDSITRISGMAMLGSGTLVPIPFVHPIYPNRSVSVSIATNGSIAVLNGNEISISSGFVDVFTR